MTTEEMRYLFEDKKLTLRQIGLQAGMSGAGVHKRLRKAAVDTSDSGRRVPVSCVVCGKSATIPRCRWRTSAKHYCSTTCYIAHLRNPNYREHRGSQRIARKIVSKHFFLIPGMVVHHHDSNTRNNDIHNLAVFASQSEHMSYERGGKAKPIWDGREL